MMSRTPELWLSFRLIPSGGRTSALLALTAEARPRHCFETGLRDRLLADLTYPIGALPDPVKCFSYCS